MWLTHDRKELAIERHADDPPDDRFRSRYASGDVPWDDADPPPEVMALADELRAGRMLDLGCGYGRSSIYLACHGWRADGVDYVDLAIEEARRRAAAAGVADRTRFVVGSVLDLKALPLEPPYDLALDVGCLHRMSERDVERYVDGLVPQLSDDAALVVFAHLRDTDADEDAEQHWIRASVLRRVLTRAFRLEREELGTTHVPGRPVRQSGWFWLRRREATDA